MSTAQLNWDNGAIACLGAAIAEARRRRNPVVEPEHVLWADVTADGGVVTLLAAAAGVPLARVKGCVENRLGKLPADPRSVAQPKFSSRLRERIGAARREAGLADDAGLGWAPLVTAVLADVDGELAADIRGLGLDPEAASGQVQAAAELTGLPETDPFAAYCLDLTERAKAGALPPVIGRDREVQQVLTVLAQKVTNNPLLLGEPGVGKTAIAEGVAQRIHDGTAPTLQGCRLLALDLGALLAGATFRGEFEERLKRVVDAAVREKGRIVLFADEIHTLLGAGQAGGGPDAANLLKPALARGELRMIGATTYAEYRRYVEKDAAFGRRFQRIDVHPPTPAQTRDVLRGLRDRFGEYHSVTYPDASLDAVVRLAGRYLGGLQFPDKAIKVLDRAGARAAVARAGGGAAGRRAEIRPEDIAAVVAEMADVPADRIATADRGAAERVAARLGVRVVGQSAAVDQVAARLRVALAAGRPRRPRGVLIFAGPPGVGKGQTAQAIGEELFPSADHVLTLDMADFSEAHTVHRLTGPPPGYVGYEEGGQLTEAVWRRPSSLVLLDHFDRAHPAVLRVLARALADGRLTDGQGKTVGFRECVIILTTHLSATDLQARPDLPAELLGLADEVVPFGPLGPEHAAALTDQFLAEVADWVAEGHDRPGPTFDLTKAARKAIAAGADLTAGGARPLRAYLDRVLVGGLVEAHPDLAAVAGRKVLVDRTGDRYTFSISRTRR